MFKLQTNVKRTITNKTTIKLTVLYALPIFKGFVFDDEVFFVSFLKKIPISKDQKFDK